MPSLIAFCVKQRLLVVFAVLGLIGGGIASLSRVAIDAVPDVTNVQVQILTSAPALAPLEIERRVTTPVELAMGGLPHVSETRSISRFGLSAVTIVFEDDIDTYFARQLVFERLAEARSQIPAEVGEPQLGPLSTGLGEIYQYELTASPDSRLDPMALRTTQDWDVRRQLLGIPGVAEVNSFGGLQKQYQVRLDPSRLAAFGVSLHDVTEAVARNNANVGGGYIEHAGEQYLLRGVGLATRAADIEQIVVRKTETGRPVFVRDLGDVVVAAAQRQGAVTADGRGEVVAGIVLMLKGANARDVVSAVKERVGRIQSTLPPGVKIRPFYDRTDLVERTMKTVERNLTEGAALVVVVLLVLLGNWRGALLVATLVPLSMLFAAICMASFGVGGNLMSLGALDFGLIVDGAVFMVENAVRRRAEALHSKGPAVSVDETIIDACSEMARPVIFAMAIVIIVYFPILSLTGIEGKMFKPMALTVLFALVGSLILTLTYVPAVLSWLLRGNVIEKANPIVDAARRGLARILPAAQRHRAMFFAGVGVLVVASVLILGRLGSEFIPRLGEGSIAVQVQRLPSTSLTQSLAIEQQVERVIASFPEVERVVSKTGRAEVATDPMGVDLSDVLVVLKPQDQWRTANTREGLVDAISDALNKRVPLAAYSFSQPIELRVSELISGVKSDIAVKIFGDDLDKLRSSGERVAKVLSGIAGAQDVKVEQTAGLPQLQIVVDRSRIARYGLGVDDVNDIVESLVVGKRIGQVFEGERRFDLMVRLAEGTAGGLEDIRNLVVPTASGARVPLRELASVTMVEGPSQIAREDGRRRIVVEMNVRGRDIGSFVADAQSAIAKNVSLPQGYYVTYGGQFENLQRAAARLAIVVPVALLLIFLLLFTTFGSLRQAWLVFSGIPLAIIGGVVGLALRGMPFSISAGVGFIALFGIAVLNGIVVVSYANRLVASGIDVAEAARRGITTQLRPVLMTSLVAALGLIPMALATAPGSEVQRPLATVVIGGLISGTLLSMIALPLLYIWWGVPHRVVASVKDSLRVPANVVTTVALAFVFSLSALLPANAQTPRPDSLSPAPLNLAAAVAEARRNNPEVYVALQGIEIASGRRLQVAQQPLRLSLGAGAAPDTPGAGGGTIGSINTGISQTFTPSATLRAGRLAGEAAVRAARLNVDALKLDIALRVVVAFYQVISADMDVAIAVQALASASEFERVARVRQSSGDLGRYEVTRAQGETRRAEGVLARQRSAAATARVSLNALLGRPNTNPLALAEPAVEAVGISDDVVDHVLLSDPVSKQIVEQITEAEARIAISRSSRLPTFSVGAGVQIARSSALGATAVGPTASIGLDVPVGDRSPLAGAIREATANRDALIAQLNVRRAALRVTVATLMEDRRGARARLAAATEGRRLAEETLQTVQFGYRRGAMSGLEVIGARSALTAARGDEAGASADLRSAESRLRLVAGLEPTP